MANIRPFKAVRPTRDKVALVASRSYHSYTKAQREARLRDNPFSFLHIINTGYKYHKRIRGKERYQLVRNRYLEFREDGIFTKDEKPNFYIYRIIDRDFQQFTGIVAAASAKDYEDDIIKKHEATLEFKEIIFKDYLKTVGFNAEPVLITYKENPTISAIIEEHTQTRPEYEFTTTYRDTHYLWCICDEDSINRIIEEFDKIDKLYIADGHHRSASSYLLFKDQLMEEPNANAHTSAYFMSYLLAESQLKIFEFNRLVKDLNGLTTEEFLIKLDTIYRIEDRGKNHYKPSKKHHFSMYLDGHFYSLYLRKHNYEITTPLDDLDAQVLYKTILQPILGIEDLRNDERIDYLDGKNDGADLKTLIDNGEYKVGFGMMPADINQVKNIADAGLIMPPKSTFIEPKLRSGITIYEF